MVEGGAPVEASPSRADVADNGGNASHANAAENERTDDGVEFEVERVIGYRFNVRYNRDEYLIRWWGFGFERDTWEPLENLIGCHREVNEFRNRVIRRAGHHVSPKRKNGANPERESDDEDILFPPDADTPESRQRRVYPAIDDSGMEKGWTPKLILGRNFTTDPKTYLISYKYKRQVEHLPVDYVFARHPKIVHEFHAKYDVDYPNPDWKDMESAGPSSEMDA